MKYYVKNLTDRGHVSSLICPWLWAHEKGESRPEHSSDLAAPLSPAPTTNPLCGSGNRSTGSGFSAGFPACCWGLLRLLNVRLQCRPIQLGCVVQPPPWSTLEASCNYTWLAVDFLCGFGRKAFVKFCLRIWNPTVILTVPTSSWVQAQGWAGSGFPA